MGLVAITEGSTFGAVDGADTSRHCAAHEGLLVTPGASRLPGQSGCDECSHGDRDGELRKKGKQHLVLL